MNEDYNEIYGMLSMDREDARKLKQDYEKNQFVDGTYDGLCAIVCCL